MREVVKQVRVTNIAGDSIVVIPGHIVEYGMWGSTGRFLGRVVQMWDDPNGVESPVVHIAPFTQTHIDQTAVKLTVNIDGTQEKVLQRDLVGDVLYRSINDNGVVVTVFDACPPPQWTYDLMLKLLDQGVSKPYLSKMYSMLMTIDEQYLYWKTGFRKVVDLAPKSEAKKLIWHGAVNKKAMKHPTIKLHP